MLFNSVEFLIFFPLVTILYFLVPHKFRWFILLVASCIFYAFLIPSYLLILFLLIVIDYLAGIFIENSTHRKKIFLWMSIIANLALLSIFKYYNFFVGNINMAIGSNFILVHWLLPVGLSFHTFQSVSYTIEVFRGKQRAVRHLGYYALYVMYYPQLVAGPIERPQNLFPQFFQRKIFSSQKLWEGLRLMIWGFFKKVVIADRLGLFVDGIYNQPGDANSYTVILATFLFGIQIYADFSGYSDIAIGASKCMGIELMTNFERPYFARNIREFWKRWHIALTSWFRDYVYIPLGGNRVSTTRHYINIMAVFILSGFWHGAKWTFIIWGILHGLYFICQSLFEKKRKLPAPIAWALTFVCVTLAWAFFRAASLQDIGVLFSHFKDIMSITLADISSAGAGNFGNFSLLLSAITMAFMFAVEKLTIPKMTNLNYQPIRDISISAIALLFIVFFGVFDKSSFIYFQF